MTAVSNVKQEFLISTPFFDAIQNGKKTVEVRIAFPTLQKIQRKDTVRFKCGQRRMKCLVDSVQEYSSFENVLQEEGLENCLPGFETIAEGVELYHSFENSEDNERQFGVIAIRIRPLLPQPCTLAQLQVEPLVGEQNNEHAWQDMDHELIEKVIQEVEATHSTQLDRKQKTQNLVQATISQEQEMGKRGCNSQELNQLLSVGSCSVATSTGGSEGKKTQKLTLTASATTPGPNLIEIESELLQCHLQFSNIIPAFGASAVQALRNCKALNVTKFMLVKNPYIVYTIQRIVHYDSQSNSEQATHINEVRKLALEIYCQWREFFFVPNNVIVDQYNRDQIFWDAFNHEKEKFHLKFPRITPEERLITQEDSN